MWPYDGLEKGETVFGLELLAKYKIVRSWDMRVDPSPTLEEYDKWWVGFHDDQGRWPGGPSPASYKYGDDIPMPDENKGIVPGLQNNPRFNLSTEGPKGLFQMSREIFKTAAAPPVQRNNTGVECPDCKAQGIIDNPVWTVPGVGLECNAGHKFRDTDQLMSRPHGTVPVAKRTVIQEGWVTIQFQVSGNVAAELRTRYPDKERMDATFAALCQHMVEPNMIMLGEADTKRIADKVGQPVRSGTELFGIIHSLQESLNNTKQELKQKEAESPSGGSGTGVQLRRGELIIWLNPQLTQKLEEKAKAAGVPKEQLIEQYETSALENDWY